MFSKHKIHCKNAKFLTNIHRKPIFSGVHTNYEIFHPTNQRMRLLHVLFQRSLSIWFDFKILHMKIDHLKTTPKILCLILLIHLLSHFLINCIHLKLLLRIYLRNFFLLSCHSWETLCFKFTPCNLKIVFASPVGPKSFFTSNFKDKVPKMFLFRTCS